MSVDYTAWAGYGVTGQIDEPSDLLRESKVPVVIRTALDNNDEVDIETAMDQWLGERGIDKLTVFVSGNAWSGVERWNVCVTSSVGSVLESDPVEFLEEPSGEELAQLQQALAMLGVETDPSWMIQLDVT